MRIDFFRRSLIIAWVVAFVGANALAVPSSAAGVMPRGAQIVSGASSAVDTRLAMNLDDLAQSGSVVFTDAMKQAAPWTSDRALSLDANGNVTQLAPGQVAQTLIYPYAVYPSGDYTLLYDGRGTIDVDPQSGTITRVAAGRAVVHVVARLGYGIRLQLSATDPANYVRNVRLVVPGFESAYQNQPFAPAFLSRLSGFNVLRFVHWSHGDTSAVPLTWPMRPAVAAFTQAGSAGVAWEYQIALANAVGADAWFVVPAGATNFYVTQLAALVHARLDPRLHAMFEYADGAWRPGSPANGYAVMAGRNFHLVSDAQSAALAWYGARSSQIYALVSEVFGADAGRIVRVLGGAAALPRSPAESVDRTIFAAAGAAQHADAFAVDTTGAAPAAIANTHALLAGTRIELIASGGAAAFTSAPNVAPATRAQLDAWRTAGGGLFAASSVNGAFAAAGLLSRLSVALEAQVDALRSAALAAYAQLHPTAHLTPLPLAAQSVLAPIVHPNTYVPSATAKKALAVTAAAGTDVLAINAGGPATGNFAADEFFSTADTWTYTTTTAVATAGVTNAAPAAVYQTQRTGVFTYTLPNLTAGTAYTVRLHFAELYFKAAAQRVFNVSVNGASAISSLDVFSAAGGADKALVENVNATANAAGQIVIAFSAVTNNPIVNGIEIVAGGGGATPTPTPTATATPISGSDVVAINAGGPATGTFAADEDFTSVSTWTFTTATTVATAGVTNPAPEAVYQSQRAGTFGYTIPGLTAGASYTLRLHFAELYFNAAGQRVFNVSVNGASALTNLDVFATAGGSFKALVENLSATANSAGQIVITFSAVTNNPIVNGIEVQTGGGGGPTPTPTPTVAPTATPAGSPADVPQYHNNTGRTGWNSSETILNTTNVASSKFGLRQVLTVDGLVMAQPLYIANYPVNGANHNVLVVATEHNSVYAFDADSGAVLWQYSFGVTQSSSTDVGCSDIEPEYGITSTPAIDRSTGTIYAVYASKTASGTLTTNVGALDLGSGTVKIPAVRIAASATLSNGSVVSYNDTQEMQRASVLLANGSIYLGFGSHCDYGLTTNSGWLMRYAESNLAQLAAFNTIEDGVSAGGTELGSIWGAGFGPSADAAGNIYTVTGNGAFDASSGGHNYGMSVLKFSPTLAGGPTDWFAYKNEAADSDNDDDFGSGGSMLLPPQAGSFPNILVQMGKTDNIYLLNQNNLGHFSTTDAGALQVFFPGADSTNEGVWGGGAYYNGPNGPTVFYQASESVMRAFKLTTGSGNPQLSVSSQGTVQPYDFGGTIPVVSSNGSAAGSGIVWTIDSPYNASATIAALKLEAYDASNVATHLFSASSGSWSHAKTNTFITPLVSNGKVYAGGYKTVYVFGLTP